MSNYATYTYYTDTYKGFAVPSEDMFDFYNRKATTYINSMSSAGSLEEADRPDELQDCACEIVDTLYGFDNDKELQSEKNSTYAVTYVQRNVKSFEKEIYDILVRLLSNTGLLYRGLCQ